ncbi:MAG: hypothetical protein QOA57_02615 [Nitrososphaeraceae archaeon]|nr:hypothetical protein [Nitrososphaeraceae archaeon]MDW0214178.1 hypothetical protein [Nitrososphaeraceae archaeon]MDW3667023.1 hypothetical protein [Nitrososphaeraceae archaeon]
MQYILAVVILTIILSLPSIGFAQNPENLSGPQVKLITPILQKISDEGTYLIAIKSGQSPISTGLNIEIVFLNKTSPYLNAPPPNAESNLSSTEYNKSSGMVVPSVIERTLPVKSYDIAINSSDGKEIWKKANQIPQGGRGPQTIMLDNYDIGNITITINNIVADPTVVDILNQNANNTNEFAALNQTESKLPTDSVKFQTGILVT